MRNCLVLVTFFLISACENSTEPPAENANTEPFIVRCDNSIPEFSLGPASNPSKDDVSQLCACIWENLGSWEREVAKAATEGREGDISDLHMRAFPSRFGSAVEKCGGMDL